MCPRISTLYRLRHRRWAEETRISRFKCWSLDGLIRPDFGLATNASVYFMMQSRGSDSPSLVRTITSWSHTEIIWIFLDFFRVISLNFFSDCSKNLLKFYQLYEISSWPWNFWKIENQLKSTERSEQFWNSILQIFTISETLSSSTDVHIIVSV